MKRKLLIILLSATAVYANAQQKLFTMQDAVLGLRGKLAPENIKQLNWLPGTQTYTFQDGDYLLSSTVPAMKMDTLLFLEKINAQLSEVERLKSIPVVQWFDSRNFYFNNKQAYYFGTIANGYATVKKWLELPAEAANVTIHKPSKQIAYTIDNNLFLINAQGQTLTVTNDVDKAIVNGQSVHRNEFGISGGIFFSPDGNRLAFYRMDERMVADYPIVNWSTVPAKNENIKYPMAGKTSHEVTLGVYNPITRQTLYLQTDAPKDQYLTCVSWSPDEKFIYVGLLNRAQNHLKLNRYASTTGNLDKTLFEERSNKYVEPQHEITFLPNSKNEFIWWSQRDGFMHLYRYNTEGKLINQITKGAWLVNQLVGFNAANKQIIIAGTKDGAKEKHVYVVNWENSKLQKLDHAPGMHTPRTNDAGTYWIDHCQSADVPRTISVNAVSGKWKRELLQAKNTLSEFKRAKVEDVTLAADDGTPLYGKLIYPTDFDVQKKYPVIVYLYNGPHLQLITNSFPASGNLWYEYLAQRGYVVFTMDGRGSSNRGLQFEQATHKQLGTVEMEDQLKGVAFLKNLSFVDADRMGVHGWSFGGFMTTSLMLRHPNVFKVGVAGGPVIDWSLYEAMYTERYMGAPQNNQKGYDENNLLTKTANLKGKLLMIHGAQDPVVVWQHSVNFVKACVDNGVQIDYFMYPGHEHNVQGKDRVHLMQKVTDYFDLYLK